jgi:hypothetical protein
MSTGVEKKKADMAEAKQGIRARTSESRMQIVATMDTWQTDTDPKVQY